MHRHALSGVVLGRLAADIHRGGVGAGGAEDADALGEAVLGCLVQRRLAVLAPRVDVCAELEQRRDALGVAAPVGVSVGLVGQGLGTGSKVRGSRVRRWGISKGEAGAALGRVAHRRDAEPARLEVDLGVIQQRGEEAQAALVAEAAGHHQRAHAVDVDVGRVGAELLDSVAQR